MITRMIRIIFMIWIIFFFLVDKSTIKYSNVNTIVIYYIVILC